MKVVELLLELIVALLGQLLVVHAVVDGSQSLVAGGLLPAAHASLELLHWSLVVAHAVAQLVLLLLGVDLFVVAVLLLQVLLLLLVDHLKAGEGLVQAGPLEVALLLLVVFAAGVLEGLVVEAVAAEVLELVAVKVPDQVRQLPWSVPEIVGGGGLHAFGQILHRQVDVVEDDA